jgi:hypothetical protein
MALSACRKTASRSGLSLTASSGARAKVAGVAVGLLAMLSMACGILPWMPSPTSRPVTMADGAGRWTYGYQDHMVTVHLNADGTFIIENSPSQSGAGIWSLVGPDIEFAYDDGGRMWGWYIIDRRDGDFAIMGGEGDPDGWGVLARVP